MTVTKHPPPNHPMLEVTFDVVRESERWPDKSVLGEYALRVASVLRDLTSGQITFVFIDDAAMQLLNKEWRGKDTPTNVLSFPDGDDHEGTIHLGDVIVAYETLTREADEAGIAFEDHLIHLLLHGSLHLLGYDHDNETEAKAMEHLEIRLLANLGIKDPYQDGDGALD